MRRAHGVTPIALISLTMLLSCVGGESPTDTTGRVPTASLSIVPVFPSQAQALGVEAAPINTIRLTVLQIPGETVVASTVLAADPNASQWDVSIEVPLSSDAGVQYVVEIELVNTQDGVETVQWSGRTQPLALTPGVSNAVRKVGVVRGPLGNLSVTSLSIAGPNTVPEQEAFTLTAQVTTSHAASQPTVFWTSLDPTIATIASDGHGLALKAGTARIQAVAGPITTVHEITVTQVPDAVAIDPAVATLNAVGAVAEFTAQVLDRSATPIEGAEVTWTLADDRIAEDLGGGRFAARAAGRTTVTATSAANPDLSATADLVVDLPPVDVAITPPSVALTQVGQTAQLAAQVRAAGGVPVFGVDLTWSSADPGVATVGPDGTVTAVSEGTTVVTVQTPPVGSPAAPLSATATVTVALEASSVQVTPATSTLTAVGAQQQLQAAAFGLGGVPIPNPTVTWSSSNTAVATVSPSGQVTAVADGTVTITATVNGVNGTASVTVDIAIGSVVVDPASATLDIDVTLGLTAQAFDLDDNATSATFTWSSSDPLIATVSADGLVTAKEPGATVITATAKGVSGSSSITVQASAYPVDSNYQTAGNTELVAGGYSPPATAHVYSATNLLATTPGLTISTVGTLATDQGGSVDILANGDFAYTPPLGFKGADQFQFTAGGSSATAHITVSGMIWYVGYGGDGDGRSNSWLPGAGSAIGRPGDIIFVYGSTGTPVSGGFPLQNGQQLIGEAAGLTVAPYGQLMAPGPRPVVQTSSAGVTLANGVVVQGLDLENTDDGIYGNAVSNVSVDDVRVLNSVNDGVSLQNPTGSVVFTNLLIEGASNYGFYVNGGDATVQVDLAGPVGISDAGGRVVRVMGTTSGSVTFTGGDIVSYNSGGFDVLNAAGNVTANNKVSVSNPTTDAFSVQNTSGQVHLAWLDAVVTGSSGIHLDSNTGVTTVDDGTIQTTDAPALSIDNAGVDVALTSVDVDNTSSGDGLYILDATGSTTIGLLNVIYDTGGAGTALNIRNAGSFAVTNPASSIQATNSQAVDLLDTQVDISLASLQDVDSPSQGLDLAGLSGSFAIAGGSISNTSDIGVRLLNGTADFHYGGDITSPGSHPVYILNVTGATVTFAGPIQSTTKGIFVASSAGTSFQFAGLDLQTGNNDALFVNGGGSLEITGSSNVIATTTGQAAYIGDIDIGPGNVTFRSISADGAGAPLNIDNTGSTGSFVVTGTGSPGSGGTVQNATGNAIYVANTHGLSLSHMIFQTPGGNGITGGPVSDFTFTDLQINNAGGRGIALTDATGAGVITQTSISDPQMGSTFVNSMGVLNLEVSNSSFTGVATAGAEGALDITIGATGSLDAVLDGTTISGNAGRGVRLSTNDGSTASLRINGGSFDDNLVHAVVSSMGTSDVELVIDGATFNAGSGGVSVLAQASSHVRAQVSNDDLTALTGYGLQLFSYDTSVLDGRVIDNTVQAAVGGIQAGEGDASDLNVWVVHNDVTTTGGKGIVLYAGNKVPSTGEANVHISDNVVATAGAYVPIALAHGQATQLCASVTGNLTTSGASVGVGLEQSGLSTNTRLERLNGGAATVTDPSVVQAYLAAENPDAPYTDATLVTAVDGVPTGTCTLPTPPAAVGDAPPVAHPQTVSTDGATPVVITLTGADPEGSNLTFSITSPPSGGSLGAITPTGPSTATVTYTPGGFGSDNFSFQVSDGGAIGSATVSVDNASPTAQDIEYYTAGNTELVAGGYAAPSTPAASNPANVFDPTPGLTAMNAGSVTSIQGGDVTLLLDGSFSYLPPAGYKGDDTFVVDAGASQATVTIHVTDMVWYVNNLSGGGDGRSDAPFSALNDVSGGTISPGDAIFVAAGDGTATGYDQGFAMNTGWRLLGEEAGLDILGVGQIVAPGGPRPILDNTIGGASVEIGGDVSPGNAIEGLEIRGTSGTAVRLYGAGPLTTIDDVVIDNAQIGLDVFYGGTLSVTNTTIDAQTGVRSNTSIMDVSFDGAITASTGPVVELDNNTAGTWNFTGGPYVAAGGSGVIVQNAAGTLDMSDLEVQPGGANGISLTGSSGTFTFTNVTMGSTTGPAISVDGGAPDVSIDVLPSGITNGSDRLLYVANTTGGSVSLTGGPLTDTNAMGIAVQSNAGTVDVANTVTITDPSNEGLYLFGAAGNVTFADLTVQTSGTDGIFAQAGTGLLTVSSGSVNTTDASGLNISQAPVDLTLGSVTVNSTNADYDLVYIDQTPTSTVSIGTLTLDSPTGNDPLYLQSAGTFQVTDGTVGSAQSPAVYIFSTDLDVNLSDLTTSPSSGTAVFLQSSSGTFAVAGGTITNVAAGAVSLQGNANLDFTFDGTIDNSAGAAINALNNTATAGTFHFGPINDTGGGIQLINNQAIATTFAGNLDVQLGANPALVATGWNTINMSGTTNTLTSVNNNAIVFSDLHGVNTLNNVTANSNTGVAITASQSVATATLNVIGGHFNNNTGGDGIIATTLSTGGLDLNLSGVEVSGNSSDGLITSAQGTGTLNLVVDNNSTFDGNGNGIRLVNVSSGSIFFDINGNQITNSTSNGVDILATTATGTIEGKVRNNTIGESQSNGVNVVAAGTGLATVEVSGNTISSTVDYATGIWGQSGQGAGSTADVSLLVLNNLVNVPSIGYGFDIESIESSVICSSIQGNTMNDPTGTGFLGIGVYQGNTSTFQLERFTGSPTIVTDVESHLLAENTVDPFAAYSGPAVAYINGAGFQPVANGACRIPSTP